jgi:hypothetical protein
MKKSLMIIVAVLAGGLLVCSCGYGGGGLDGGTDGGQDGNGGGDQAGNECEQAAEIFWQGWDQACAPRATVCCFCKCWFDGRKAFNADEYFQNEICICEVPQPNPQPCEGDALLQAQQCLADETACREQAIDLVIDEQIGQCTNTPL